MTPNVTELLHSARDTCRKIVEITDGLSLQEYLSSELHRYSVNWNVVILGEALNLALSEADDLHYLIPSARQAIATRHRIAHGYRTIDDTVMYDIATIRVPVLLEEIEDALSN
jgi:uncharacterized protein with HEPN domain